MKNRRRCIPVEYTCTVCGGSYEESYVCRIYGNSRYDTAYVVADALKEQLGVEKFENIIVASSQGYADALAGSYLAAVKNAPILLVNKSLNDDQMEFLANSSCEFVIIGGTGAVSEELEKELQEFGTTTRLGGAGRYETCVKVAQHFFPEGADSAIVAYSRNFPDGLCGGPLAYALKAPLLLLQTNRGPEVIEYAQEVGIQTGAVLGGTGLIDVTTAMRVFAMN